MLQLISLTEEPDDDHLSIRKTKINICRKNFFQKTNPKRELSEVLACTWGGPSPLTSNIPQHLLQAICELVPVANQWESAGSSRGLAVL